MQLDAIDQIAAVTLEGYLVRKDLVRTFSRQFPVPTYVVEFLLGRYCASTDSEEIEEGLEIVQRQLADRTVKAGDEELFKSRCEKGEVKIIDVINARLDAKTDSYLATLPSLRLNNVRINPEMVKQHERMLTGGFYAEISLGYDAAIAQEKNGRPFGIDGLREIQLSKRDVLDVLARLAANFRPGTGRSCFSAASESSRRDLANGRRMPFCCGWFRSSSGITTSWNWGRGGRARVTCSSRFRPTHI